MELPIFCKHLHGVVLCRAKDTSSTEVHVKSNPVPRRSTLAKLWPLPCGAAWKHMKSLTRPLHRTLFVLRSRTGTTRQRHGVRHSGLPGFVVPSSTE